MELLACSSIASKVKSGTGVYLILVSQDCAFCKQVLDELQSYKFNRPIIVMDADTCSGELNGLVEYEYLPMIFEFSGGKPVRSGVGVDEIRDFDAPAPVSTQVPQAVPQVTNIAPAGPVPQAGKEGN